MQSKVWQRSVKYYLRNKKIAKNIFIKNLEKVFLILVSSNLLVVK